MEVSYTNSSNAGEGDNPIKIINEDGAYLQYCGYLPQIRKKFLSPFQHENTPSFCFYPSIRKGFKYYFQCYSTGYKGDVITFCELLFNDSFAQACNRLISDGFAEGSYLNTAPQNTKSTKKVKINHQQLINQNRTEIKVVTREYTTTDEDYWSNFGIPIDYLKKRNIKPCKEVWFNNFKYGWIKWVDGDNLPIYRYLFGDTYKIYNPTNYKNIGKWLSNIDNTIIQGLEYISPDGGDLLVITKSYKDVLALNYNFNIDAIAFQSEQFIPSEQVIEYFNNLYVKIVLLYDNDAPGLKASERFIEKHPHIINTIVPIETGSKDISDYYRDYGKDEFIKLIKNMLKI